MPSSKADSLPDNLAERDITAAVEVMPVEEEEQPPTLIEYPRWARPIKALFDMLGTLPGYKEYDISPFFMVARTVSSLATAFSGSTGSTCTTPNCPSASNSRSRL
ncbi:hypothetical protein ACFL5Z_14625 [Planctomycetota bacterium]